MSELRSSVGRLPASVGGGSATAVAGWVGGRCAILDTKGAKHRGALLRSVARRCGAGRHQLRPRRRLVVRLVGKDLRLRFWAEARAG